MCESVDNLKNYKTSITSTCMVYQNHTARQIKPEIYKKPYIGADAYKKQLEIKIIQRNELTEKLQIINYDINIFSKSASILKELNTQELINNSISKIELKEKQQERMLKKSELERIDRSTVLEIQLELDNLNKDIEKLKNKKDMIIKEYSEANLHMKNITNQIKSYELQYNEKEDNMQVFEEVNIDVIFKAKERYDKNIVNKDLLTVKANCETTQKSYNTKEINETANLRSKQRDYNKDFDFSGAEGMEGMNSFFAELKTLKESRMLEYEEKIKNAKQRAEEEFKDHFVAKLQENIILAQDEFKKLNSALKGIKFGNDEYKFSYYQSKNYSEFYEMIMDNNNLDGENLFTGIFRENHKEALSELFERITIDDEQSKKALEQFTDYRTYMDYDIKISHNDGSTTSFSKVCREKSGGETQTPYYVIIAASFVQLYNSSFNESPMGLIMFDEAFDKMDENRIESMMKFLNKLNLQVIIAAPPQKVENISPYVRTTIVITKENNFTWAEAFHNEELQ